jgi:hypothetical protein
MLTRLCVDGIRQRTEPLEQPRNLERRGRPGVESLRLRLLRRAHGSRMIL